MRTICIFEVLCWERDKDRQESETASFACDRREDCKKCSRQAKGLLILLFDWKKDVRDVGICQCTWASAADRSEDERE